MSWREKKQCLFITNIHLLNQKCEKVYALKNSAGLTSAESYLDIHTLFNKSRFDIALFLD